MKRNITIILILICSILEGQKFEIITLKDSVAQNTNYEVFEFINDDCSTDNLQFLARISCEGEKSAFSNVYEIAKFNSQKLGANSFKYIKKDESKDQIKVYFDIYFSSKKYLIENRKHDDENKIFIFGSDNLDEKKKRYYKLNGKLKILPNAKFDVINYELGSTIKISKKDFMAIPIVFNETKNFKSIFLNTDGWGRNESLESLKNYGIVSVTTYELFYMFDKNIGFTLLKIKE